LHGRTHRLRRTHHVLQSAAQRYNPENGYSVLLYTAVTRAKTLCVLAGNRRAIGMAVRNNQVAKRFTALAWRLGKME